MSTATTAGAKAHARAQESATPVTRPDPPEGVDPASVTWSEIVAGGGYAHAVLAPGTLLELTDLDGDACAGLLLYNALETHERLNVADTVKVQWQVYTAAGQILLSDQGRALATVVGDTSGRHDSFFGVGSRDRNERRYGDGSPQGPSPAGRELFKLAAAKHGLGPRDIPPALTFFQGVRIAADGTPEFLGSAGAGATLRLRADMPVVVLIANTAHPRDSREAYTCGRLGVVAWRPGSDVPTAEQGPEARRAYRNTSDYLRARGLS
ncbi:urea amidolyase associated protein UAAP1 [Actinoplanes rectilineatus]|uniref:urea amidolyase associated protein UAAP1 n=1 Tax=Actinoplanes rectilineatus TaxID=113571 RepID=UPI0005F28B4C|nr:urea amidolyase associated protein UAAP1 [Actinoplanes rectilineatus]